MKIDEEKLVNDAKQVLELNNCGRWTRPAPDLYPHQWLWDSAFISIGLSHYDLPRAQTEIMSMMRGQWQNGMIPHMIFSEDTNYYAGPNIWKSSKVTAVAPSDVETSGISQPPVLAEAVVRIGKQLKRDERKKFYKKVYPHLLKHHSWLYQERDPHNEGVVVLIHPWETGLDNTPPWMEEMRENQMPNWIRAVDFLKLSKLFELFRQDTKLVPAAERIRTVESLNLFHVLRRLRKKHYNSLHILRRSHFSVNDIGFNSILVRNNHHLEDIARELHETIPAPLRESFDKAEHAIDSFWDEQDSRFYSKNFVTQEVIRSDSISGILPLYSGAVSKKRAKDIVKNMKTANFFWSKHPVSSAPKSSKYFQEHRYWQGPAWINTNWLIIDGLRQYGFNKEADELKKKTLSLVAKNGFYEYFSPIDGSGAGIKPFSWSAALTIDLIED